MNAVILCTYLFTQAGKTYCVLTDHVAKETKVFVTDKKKLYKSIRN